MGIQGNFKTYAECQGEEGVKKNFEWADVMYGWPFLCALLHVHCVNEVLNSDIPIKILD